MPIIGSFAAGSAGGFGQRKGAGFQGFDADYLIVAGGGPGGPSPGGGGGAGGHRSSFPGGTKISLDQAVIPITVGAGGPAGSGACGVGIAKGTDSTIGLLAGDFSSSAGGAGVNNVHPAGTDLNDGGSGGGTPHQGSPAGCGNIGGYTPPEGNNGGTSGGGNYGGSGGGGIGGVGSNASPGAASNGGPGGPGVSNSITGSGITRAGGGGGAAWNSGGSGGTGGPGGGGPGTKGPNAPKATAGTDGLGGGGGGSGYGPTGGQEGGNGGTGVVIIRIPSADAPGSLAVAPGTNTLSTDGPTGDKICTFTVDGTLTLA